MVINRAAIKRNAKLDLRQAKPNAYLFTLIYLIFIMILSVLSMEVLANPLEGGAVYYNPGQGIMSGIIGLLLDFMSMILGVGYLIYALNISRHIPASYGNLLDGFGFFFKALWLYILIGIKTFLWSLLFFVPGIIAALRYSQAVYVLIENPELSASACIRASSEMMRGHKGEYFVLNLSFLGWILLSMIPFVQLYTMPYMNFTYANYYNALLGLHGQNQQPHEAEPWEQ